MENLPVSTDFNTLIEPITIVKFTKDGIEHNGEGEDLQSAIDNAIERQKRQKSPLAIQDFRIGIYLNLLVKNEDFGEVKARIPFRVKDGKHIDTLLSMNNGDHFEPIPLSPELIKRLEWVPISEGYSFYFPDGCAYGEITYFNHQKVANISVASEGACVGCDFKYLHEIQNAFWCLTGTELPVNNL